MLRERVAGSISRPTVGSPCYAPMTLGLVIRALAALVMGVVWAVGIPALRQGSTRARSSAGKAAAPSKVVGAIRRAILHQRGTLRRPFRIWHASNCPSVWVHALSRDGPPFVYVSRLRTTAGDP